MIAHASDKLFTSVVDPIKYIIVDLLFSSFIDVCSGWINYSSTKLKSSTLTECLTLYIIMIKSSSESQKR